jgi:hypothetical protein
VGPDFVSIALPHLVAPTDERESVVKVTVWHKTDEQTWFRPYEPGHPIEPVFEFELRLDELERDERLEAHPTAPAEMPLLVIAEDAFAAFNGHPPDGWEDRSKDYYAQRLRSLSVGDLVVFGEVALAVERFGFRAVPVPGDATLEHRLDRLKTAAKDTPAAQPPQVSP